MVHDNTFQASGDRMEMKLKTNDILRKHLERNLKKFTKDARHE